MNLYVRMTSSVCLQPQSNANAKPATCLITMVLALILTSAFLKICVTKMLFARIPSEVIAVSAKLVFMAMEKFVLLVLVLTSRVQLTKYVFLSQHPTANVKKASKEVLIKNALI